MTMLNDDNLNQEAMTLLSQGQIASAYAKMLEAIAMNPQRVALYFNAATISLQMRQPIPAMQHIVSAIAINANDGDLWMLRGQIELRLQKWSDARTSFIRASVIFPTQSRPLIELAALSVSQGDYEAGIIYYRHAILLEPTNVHANMALGELYHELNMFIPACTLLKQAVNIAPDNAAVRVSLAASLYRLEQYREALNHLHVSEKINPDDALLHNNLGMVFNALSDKQNALVHFRKATRLEPKRASSWSNLLLHMHYQADISPQEILLEASNFNAIFSGSGITKSAEHATTSIKRDIKQKLRIGYVSGDFRHHAVGLFIEPILAHHDKERFDVFAYADVSTLDNKSLRIKNLVHQWRDISTLSHGALLQQIRNDKIDILVDLAGHTANNRLPMFAQRAAPVQITWLGYPGTTGLTNMDYLLTDVIADPDDDTQHLMSEKPLRLPYGMFCYQPELDWAGGVEIAPPPAIKNGFITFASFNNLAKVNDSCLVLWREILSEVPDSRLIVKGKPFSDPQLVSDWRDRLSRLDLPNDRIQLLPYEKLQAHFASYNEVDILLDTFPYNGGTTSCDSLWMGVPVVTYTGAHRPARVGASILTQAGKAEWIAKDQTEYVEIAVKLASDVRTLANVRLHLREDLRRRPMCDAKEFTRALELVYSGL